MKGFTLIELLVSMAILVILAAIAAPSMNEFSDRKKVVGPTRSFMTDLEFARSEAVARGTDITMCASSNGANCSGSTSWKEGWIITINDANDCPLGECILRANNSIETNIELNATESTIVFNELGEANAAATFAVCGHQALENNDREDSRTITLNASGNRSMSKGTVTCNI